MSGSYHPNMVVYHISWKNTIGFQDFFARIAKKHEKIGLPPIAVPRCRFLEIGCAVLVNDASFDWLFLVIFNFP